MALTSSAVGLATSGARAHHTWLRAELGQFVVSYNLCRNPGLRRKASQVIENTSIISLPRFQQLLPRPVCLSLLLHSIKQYLDI